MQSPLVRPRFAQTDVRVNSEGGRLLPSLETISHAPELRARWLNQQVKAGAVTYLKWFFFRLDAADFCVGEHDVGILVGIKTVGPSNP